MNRKQARENAFLLLFEREINKDEDSLEIIVKAAKERGLECDEYVKTIYFGALENRDEIEEAIEKSLVGWKRERVSYVSRALLTLATYEMMYIDDIPTKVSINEAIELSKKYDEEKAYVFVNGVLHAVSKLVRCDE